MRLMSLFSLVLFACDDHQFSGGSHEVVAVTGESFEAVEAVFLNNCAACHSTGAQAPDLSANICDNLVGVASLQLTSMEYIAVGEPDQSYLLHRMKKQRWQTIWRPRKAFLSLGTRISPSTSESF